MTHDRHAAEDLTQETFLKAFAGLNRFQAGTNFAAWLFRIAHNNFANGRRAKVISANPCRMIWRQRTATRWRRLKVVKALRDLAHAVDRVPRNSGGPAIPQWNKNCRSVRSPMFSD